MTPADTLLESAQRRYSLVIAHVAWYDLFLSLGRVGVREATRFISASQWCAGHFLNAVPALALFRMETGSMRYCMQRRLGCR